MLRSRQTVSIQSDSRIDENHDRLSRQNQKHADEQKVPFASKLGEISEMCSGQTKR